MTAELHRLGVVRAMFIVAVGAIVAIALLALSGLSVARTGPAPETVRPAAITTAAQAPRPGSGHPARVARHSRKARTTARKRCSPAAGVAFTVGAGVRCPRRVAGERRAGLPPTLLTRLRKAASRSVRPAPGTPPSPHGKGATGAASVGTSTAVAGGGAPQNTRGAPVGKPSAPVGGDGKTGGSAPK